MQWIAKTFMNSEKSTTNEPERLLVHYLIYHLVHVETMNENTQAMNLLLQH